MTPTYEDLQEQVRELRATLKQLTGSEPEHARLRALFGLTPKQAQTLSLLINAPRCTVDSIYANVFEYPNGDGPDFRIIRVIISQIRSRLRAFSAPGQIVTYYGNGTYELSSDLRSWLKGKIEPEAIAA